MFRNERFLDGDGSFRFVRLVTFGLAFRICFFDWFVNSLKACRVGVGIAVGNPFRALLLRVGWNAVDLIYEHLKAG